MQFTAIWAQTWPAADKCVRACVYYSNSSSREGGVWGGACFHSDRTWIEVCALLTTLLPWCCVVIVNRDADFESVFSFLFFGPLFCPPSLSNKFRAILVQLTVSTWNTASVVKQREGARDDGRGPCKVCQFPLFPSPRALCALWDAVLRCQFSSALDLLHICLLLSMFRSFVLPWDNTEQVYASPSAGTF